MQDTIVHNVDTHVADNVNSDERKKAFPSSGICLRGVQRERCEISDQDSDEWHSGILQRHFQLLFLTRNSHGLPFLGRIWQSQIGWSKKFDARVAHIWHKPCLVAQALMPDERT